MATKTVKLAMDTALADVSLGTRHWRALGGLVVRGSPSRTVGDILAVDVEALRGTWSAADVRCLRDLQSFLRMESSEGLEFYAERDPQTSGLPGTVLIVRPWVTNGGCVEGIHVPLGSLDVGGEASWVAPEHLADRCERLTEREARELNSSVDVALQHLESATDPTSRPAHLQGSSSTGPAAAEVATTSGASFAVNYAMLNELELRMVMRLRKHWDREVMLSDIALDRLPPGVGRRVAQELLPKLAAATRGPAMAPDGLPVYGAAIPVPGPKLESAELERVLLDDLERFLAWLPEKARRVARERWGYRCQQRSLQEIGDDFGQSRESIRQIQIDVEMKWPQSIRVHTTGVRRVIEPMLDAPLVDQLPELAAAFTEPILLLEFIERSAGVEPQTYVDLQIRDEAKLRLLAHVFTDGPLPVSVEDCLRALTSEYGMDERKAHRFIDSLLANGDIELVGDGVAPHALTQRAAVEHVLLSYPSGLAYGEIARIANERRLTKDPLPAARTRAFGAERVYLCGSGAYRHWSFLEAEGHRPQAVVERVAAWLASQPEAAANLHSIVAAIGDELGLDYFRLRAFVAEYGAEAGLDFDGRSRADTVTLGVRDGRRKIADAVYDRATQSRDPVRPEVIAATLHLSLAMATVVLDRLVDEHRVVRIDRAHFATRERAFGGLDVAALASRIDAILREAARPVEAESLRRRLECETDQGRSKYFYMSFVRTFAADYGWYVARTLLSSAPIHVKGLADLVRQYSDASIARPAAVARVQSEVLVDEDLVVSLLGRPTTPGK